MGNKKASKFETKAIPFLRAAGCQRRIKCAACSVPQDTHGNGSATASSGNTPRADTHKDLELSSAGLLLHFVLFFLGGEIANSSELAVGYPVFDSEINF